MKKKLRVRRDKLANYIISDYSRKVKKNRCKKIMINKGEYLMKKNKLLYYIMPFFAFFLTQCTTYRYPVTGVSRSSESYYVQGTWHSPQKYYDYDKIGLASWYGPGFHGGKKAQGETYNQYSMTAAHKTLPLPTIVRITNLENGKKVILLVDDRGPFKYKNRIIDLSVSAAKELGLYNKGIGRVRVQALPKESQTFSIYLKNNCGKFGVKTKGHSWEEIYRKNIGNRGGFHNLTTLSHKVNQLNEEEKKHLMQKKYVNQKKKNISKPIFTARY
jgi:rare lipoprotein A